MSAPTTEIPIFLRKTYALIEACSNDAPRVCSWTDDGKTFTVYDLDQFEQKHIPLFFKHSKFSSFVRQLNFYSFRKIKEDAIRLDLDSANEKNHWKFRHDKFQRGRPGLMAEMKRMASKQNPKPAAALAESSVATAQPQGNKEVQNLKKRIEEMNKSIESLTAMVEKVSLKQEQDDKIDAGNKRKKIDKGQVSSFDETSLDVFPEPSSGVSSSLVDSDNDMTDDAFLDQLFLSFQDEGASSVAIPDDTFPEEVSSSSPPDKSNRPDPVLMKKLGDALELLPKVIQEMIINRLIHAITEGLDEPMPTLASLLHEGKKLQKAIPVIPVHA